MKLVTLEEYSEMNWPSVLASIIFCIHLGHNTAKHQSFFFPPSRLCFAILCSLVLHDHKMKTLLGKEF